MKEINEVIQDYEDKKIQVKLMEEYRQLFSRTKILVKNDLCKTMDIENFDNYTRIPEFTGSIVKDNRVFLLYIDNKSNMPFFINKSRTNYETGLSKGIVLKTNHISDSDINKILQLALEEQKKAPIKESGLSDILYIIAGIILFIGFIMFIIALEEGALALLVPIPFITSALIFIALAKILDNLKDINTKIDKIENKDIFKN